MQMVTATIDAGVLGVPGGPAPEETHRYVSTLLDWATLLDEPWVAICMSERASEALIEDGLYPLRDALRSLFRSQGIVEYDVNTVAQVVDRLLRLTPSFEAYFRVRDVLAEEVATTPDILQLWSGTRLQSDLARCVVLIAILRQHCRQAIGDHSLILREAPNRIVRVRALVHALEHERTDLDMLPSPPKYFDGDVLACDDFCGLLECIDERAVLRGATDDVAVELACRIALFKFRTVRSLEPEWEDTEGICLGPRFRDRVRRCWQDASESFAERLLRAIVETIDGENMRAVHALRTGSGGNDPQRRRRRDDAKAWRRDVDNEYHLHYWELEDGSVELASVGVHNDFSIPE
jgi:hypothetical protein